MKSILLFLIFSYSLQSFSQDAVRIKKIDSLVKSINSGDFKIQTDSIIRDLPQIGLFMKTFLTTVTDSNQLKKYVNKVNSITKVNNVSIESIASNSFYFDQGHLIKVEEFMIKDGKEINADWYYADDKSLYYTLKNERSEERAKLLLEMAKGMLKQINR